VNQCAKYRKLIAPSLALALTAFPLAGSAVADPPTPPRPHAPPPEAFQACEGKVTGDPCTVHVHETDVGGTCAAPPGESRLACRPNHPPPPPPPPPEAFTACEGKASGTACTVHLHEMDVSGTCGTLPGDARLVCVPKDLPPPSR
jgi:hypothetical protein